MNKLDGIAAIPPAKTKFQNTTSKKPSLLKYHCNQVFYAKNITMHYMRVTPIERDGYAITSADVTLSFQLHLKSHLAAQIVAVQQHFHQFSSIRHQWFNVLKIFSSKPCKKIGEKY
jgi:hypothetical protein